MTVVEWVAAVDAAEEAKRVERKLVASMSTSERIASGLAQFLTPRDPSAPVRPEVWHDSATDDSATCMCCGALVGDKLDHVNYHRAQVDA